MASNGTRFTDRAALTLGDDATGGSWPFGDVTRLQLVHHVGRDSEAALASAGAALARVEQEVDQLWCDSMQALDRATSQRLAELSHALHRAALLLEHDDAIG
jgi:hypothetical protein